MRCLIVNLKDKNKTENNIEVASARRYDIYIEIEEMVSKKRRLLNLKRKLYLENNLHWDEEFY
jgi:hypothetical protein